MNWNITIPKLALALILPTLITGCTLNFSVPSNEVVRLSIYEPGQPVYTRELEENDALRQAINRWFAANPDGWNYAFFHRDPYVYLKGKDFSVNILKSEVSVKYCHAFFACLMGEKENHAFHGCAGID